MPEVMTKTQLLHILMGDIAGGGFHEAHSAAAGALGEFEGPVWRALASETYWSDFGQADATSVAQTNTIAMHIATVQMDLGAKVVDGASTAFSALASGFADLNDYAKSQGMWITESGTVIFDENNPNHTEGMEPAFEVVRKNIEFSATNFLKLATLTDQSTAASLDSIERSAPKVTVTVDPGALDYNQDALDQALADRDGILDLVDSWSVLDDTAFVGVEDVKAAGTNNLEDMLRVRGITLSEDLDMTLKVLGQTPLGSYLNVLQGNVPGLIGDGIQWGLERASSHAGFGPLAELLAKGAGRFLGIAGWATFAGDVAIYLAGKLAPDGLPATTQVIDPDGKVRAEVFDERLSELGQQFYSTSPSGNDQSPDHVGTGNLADLALQQRLNGVGADEPDYVAEAEELRANLKSWLDGHADDGSADPDVAYARSLVEELDTAVGNY